MNRPLIRGYFFLAYSPIIRSFFHTRSDYYNAIEVIGQVSDFSYSTVVAIRSPFSNYHE